MSPWASGDSLTPSTLNRQMSSYISSALTRSGVFNVLDYGATGDGQTDDTSAFTRALSGATRGDVVMVPSSVSGYRLGSPVTVPIGVTVRGEQAGLHASRWIEGTGFNSASSPGGAFVRLSDRTLPAFVLQNNSALEGLTFFYPDQAWDYNSINSSFVTFAPTIQLGASTTPSESLNNIGVRDCHFLGATVGMRQAATNGEVLNNLQIVNCSGTVLGTFAFLRVTSDPVYVNNISLSPAYAIGYVQESGGSQAAFRTKMAQLAKAFEFGSVADVLATNVFAYGQRYMIHYNNDMYTGDPNEEGGGSYTNFIADICEAAVRYDRNSNIHPLNLTNGWATPVFRANGAASDSPNQGLLSIRSSTKTLRFRANGVRMYGQANVNYLGGYTDVPNHAIVSENSVTGGGNNVVLDNCFLDSLTSTIADPNTDRIVRLGINSLTDVPQYLSLPVGSRLTIGTALAPTYAFQSEQSLGLYRSAASILKGSYGWLSADFISSSTTNQSLVTAKVPNQGQLVFSIQSLTTNGATLGIRSGNSVWVFRSTELG